MKCSALLIDTVSIQKYVFGSNRLKENLGASYLVDDIYKSHLKTVVLSIYSGVDLAAWQSTPEKILLKKQPVEIGYIGGGNALLFFKEEAKASEFIQKWTKRLLVYTPRLTTAVASKNDFDLSDKNFHDLKDEIFSLLDASKNRNIPQTVIPRHGITDECRSSGFSMDDWQSYLKPGGDEDEKRSTYVSAVTRAKLQAGEISTKTINEEFAELLGSEYCFTDELDKLGQTLHEDNQIAVVHIDGNEMGKRFRQTQTLIEIRHLSKSVKEATDGAFQALLKAIKRQIDTIDDEFALQREESGQYEGRKVLPIRPIIRGGDDVTFVCPGKLGIYFAKLFLESFAMQGITDGQENIPHDACAGIAIVKTKYPFYRAYDLAEALCKQAKKIRKAHKKQGSWLDFHITYGGFTGTLEQIRTNHYQVSQDSLLVRPYQLNGYGLSDFETLVNNTRRLLWRDSTKRKVNFPNSKLKELRKVLTLGEHVSKSFMMKMKEKGVDFERLDLEPVFKESLFKTGVHTPYFDMIEMAEYYPEFELLEKGG